MVKITIIVRFFLFFFYFLPKGEMLIYKNTYDKMNLIAQLTEVELTTGSAMVGADRLGNEKSARMSGPFFIIGTISKINRRK